VQYFRGNNIPVSPLPQSIDNACCYPYNSLIYDVMIPRRIIMTKITKKKVIQTILTFVVIEFLYYVIKVIIDLINILPSEKHSGRFIKISGPIIPNLAVRLLLTL
jgi:hypothetical protein